MEVSSEEGEIPIPINSTTTTNYGGGKHGNGHGHGHEEHGNISHHHHHNGSSVTVTQAAQVAQAASSSALQVEDPGPYNATYTTNTNNNNSKNKKVVRYRECLKNHAASMGGNALDGCGEFMASGEEGTLEALTCSACHCHRNFHRKEAEADQFIIHPTDYHKLGTTKFLLAHHHHKTATTTATATAEPLVGYPTAAANILPSRAVPPLPPYHHQMILPYNVGPLSLPSECEEEEEEEEGTRKKRFRTKFTQEQKEKMVGFAERVGWKIQKQEESVVQQFCQEIGVKRRVLKVWMHNNKHNFAKKNTSSSSNPIPPTTTATTNSVA